MAFKFRIFDFLKGNQTKQGIEYFDIKIATQLSYKILAVHVAASYIANAISKCDIKIYRKKEEIKDLENYLWLFTKDYPTIYEVWNKKEEVSLNIVGETELFDSIRKHCKQVFLFGKLWYDEK